MEITYYVSPQERIHRRMADWRLLAIPTDLSSFLKDPDLEELNGTPSNSSKKDKQIIYDEEG
jgi:hypothetical protein